MSSKPLVDPLCMCGKAHPCPDHGRFVGLPAKPHQMGPTRPDHMTVAERRAVDARARAVDERTQWIMAKEMVAPRLRLVRGDEEAESA